MSDKLETTIQEFKGNADALVIIDDEKFTQAGVDLQRAKILQKEIDETFDPIITKTNEAHKEAIVQKKKFAEPLTQAIGVVKRVMLTYKKKKDDAAAEKQRKIDAKNREVAEKKKLKEAEDLEKQGRREEADAKLDENTVVAPVAREVAPTIGGVSYRKNWKMRITNPALVPDEWKLIDEKGLRAFAKSSKGRIPVPGVEFYPEESMANRV